MPAGCKTNINGFTTYTVVNPLKFAGNAPGGWVRWH